MWINDPFFKYTTAIIFVLTIILLFYYASPVFAPVLWFVAAILLPVLFSTLLYYILRPLVNFINRWTARYIAIFFSYFILSIVIATLAFFVVPQIAHSIENISPESINSLKNSTQNFFENLTKYNSIFNFLHLEETYWNYLPKLSSFMYSMMVNLIATLASIAVGLALTPFVLYYFLRDDHFFPAFILRYVPEKFRSEVDKPLIEMDMTLSRFIGTQMIVATIIGTLLFIGYLIIGLPNALALALFAMIFYVIPFVGTFIAIIPALIVAFSIGLSTAFEVLIVMFLAHFFEANLLTPRLISDRLHIHPLTIILLLLAGGSLYGLFGLLLITPTYAILKVIVWNIYKIWKLNTVTNRMDPTFR